jgi:hypothetical protein
MIIPNSNYWGSGEESFFGLLEQLKDPSQGESGASEVVFRNLEVTSLEDAAARMEKLARAIKDYNLMPTAYHVGLSFSEGDVEGLNQGDLFSIANQFLEERGLSNHQHVFLLHEDGHHPHVHCVVSRVSPEKEVWEKDGEVRDYDQNLKAAAKLTVQAGFPTSPDPTRGSTDSWRIQRAKRTGNPALGEVLRKENSRSFENVGTWVGLQRALSTRGTAIRRKDSGGVVTDGSREAPLSNIRRMWSFPILDDYFPEQFKQIDYAP